MWQSPWSLISPSPSVPKKKKKLMVLNEKTCNPAWKHVSTKEAPTALYSPLFNSNVEHPDRGKRKQKICSCINGKAVKVHIVSVPLVQIHFGLILNLEKMIGAAHFFETSCLKGSWEKPTRSNICRGVYEISNFASNFKIPHQIF